MLAASERSTWARGPSSARAASMFFSLVEEHLRAAVEQLLDHGQADAVRATGDHGLLADGLFHGAFRLESER
ncbi:hypothetical protein SFUMM280S_07718 [Streptomyces fumanus]